MKYLTALLLAGICSNALADSTTHDNPIVEHPHWGEKLDIAKVLSTTEVPNTCEITPVRMVYLDSEGKSHILEYLVLGNGCSGG